MRSTLTTRRLAAGVAAALTAAVYLAPTPAADHRDGPFFGGANTPVNGTFDINDVYLFQAPGNAANTVMIYTVSPFAGASNGAPVTFNPTAVYDFRVDNTGDAVEDLIFRVTVGPADTAGVQSFVLRGLPASRFPAAPGGILARGQTGQNVPVAGGGMFRAAVQDDPFFFDANQFNRFVAAGQGSPSRNPGVNFFGPNANTLAFTLEVPTASLRSSPTNPNISLNGVLLRNGVQIDRMGRPAINTVLIPPVPRNNMTFGERRNAFNAALPRNDRRNFRSQMVFLLQNVFQRNATDSAGLADFLLPDVLTFDTSVAFNVDSAGSGGFPNGRRMRDDVIDVEYGLILTAFGITSDNLPDDNGERMTDGTRRPDGSLRPIAFPYIGPPNNPSQPINTMN